MRYLALIGGLLVTSFYAVDKKDKQYDLKYKKSVRTAAVLGLIDKDLNLDGKPDIFVVNDKSKRVRLIQADSNFDGKIDIWHYYRKNGLLLQTDIDRNHDGLVDKSIYYERNQVRYIAIDLYFRGRLNYVIAFHSAHNTVTATTDRNYDGFFEYWELFRIDVRKSAPAFNLSHRRIIAGTRYNKNKYVLVAAAVYQPHKRGSTYKKYDSEANLISFAKGNEALVEFKGNRWFADLSDFLQKSVLFSCHLRSAR